MKNKLFVQLFIIYSRYLIGGAFVFASLIKLKGKRFTSGSGALEPIDSSWHFFETMYQSGIYWNFIGLGQLIAGGLLMTQRFSTLGAIVNLPIITNVFVITISYSFGLTPLITGGMLLVNVLLLLWDWNKLKVLLNLPMEVDERISIEDKRIWERIGLLLFSFTFIYRLLVNNYNIFLWFTVCLITGLLALIAGLYKWRKEKVPTEKR